MIKRLIDLFFREAQIPFLIKMISLPFIVLIHCLFGLIIALAQRLLAPILLVRVGRMHNQRIGHFILEFDWFNTTSISSEQKLPFHINLFFLSGRSSNVFLEKIVKYHFCVISGIFLTGVFLINRILRGGEKYLIKFPVRPTDFRYLDDSPVGYVFTNEEDLLGRSQLAKTGANPDEPIVCFYVRDSAYAGKFFQEQNQNFARYRDCDVVNFEKSMEFLANNGYQVFRMGKYGEKPLSIKHPKIFDYSFSDIRNDFLDFYISSKCEFAVATDSGSMMLPIFFRKPLLLVNVPAFHGVLSGKCLTLFQFKTFIDIESSKEINLSTLIQRGMPAFESSEAFINAGIKIEENSSLELLNAVKEMLVLKDSKVKNEIDYYSTQKMFNSKLKLIGLTEVSGKLSLSWLKEHSNFLK
jgi:putative glycosyltransferase (TIGR04372 family)